MLAFTLNVTCLIVGFVVGLGVAALTHHRGSKPSAEALETFGNEEP